MKLVGESGHYVAVVGVEVLFKSVEICWLDRAVVDVVLPVEALAKFDT